PATVTNAIVSTATSNKVTNAMTGSPNKLLFSPLTAESGGGTGGSTTTYSGSLSGTGYSQYQPSSSGFTTTGAGAHVGKLTGPSGTDFDLYLQRWNGSSWVTVASGESASSSESVTYNATASGSFRWRVYSYSGSGSYSFTLTRPS
ncbi:MAG: S8 family peptidase, partial [Gemmatimonadetes bacterium]|nr:S8 family peptidase [Gemmatimonadota bacterium]